MQSYKRCATYSCCLSLHEAAARNDVEHLTYRLHASIRGLGVVAVSNHKNEHGKTPLHFAAEKNVGSSHYEVIEILLKNGADPNALDKSQRSPLCYLVWNEPNIEIIKLFLKFKADITAIPEYGASFLSPAVRYSNSNSLNILKFLVEDIGLNVSHRDVFDRTPLQYIAGYNKVDSHYEVLKYLLENGADPNAKDFEGKTPFRELVSDGNSKVVDLFLNHNADANSVSENGLNILFEFDYSCCDVQVLDRLINDFDLDVNQTEVRKLTLLHSILDTYEKELVNINVIKCFLKYGANINAPDEYGITPFITAVIKVCDYNDEDWFLKNFDCFSFIIDQIDFSVIHNNKHVFGYYSIVRGDEKDHPSNPEYLWKWILKHLAKLNFLNIQIHPIVLKIIEDNTNYKDYFEKCTIELQAMSDTKPQNCWINFFNLLVDSRRKLKNYTGNEDLILDYKNNDWLDKFPIYGALIKKNMEKGIKRRKFFDKSSIVLSECLPIFNPNHIIVRDTLDCILSKKDLSKFCE